MLNESSVFRLEFCAFPRGRHLGKSGRPVIHMAGLGDDVLRVLGDRRAGEIHSGPSRPRFFCLLGMEEKSKGLKNS